MGLAEQFVGRYYSKAWIQKNVLHMDEEEADRIKNEIVNERVTEQQDMLTRAQDEAIMNQQVAQIQAQYAPPQAAVPVAGGEQQVSPENAAAQQQGQQQ